MKKICDVRVGFIGCGNIAHYHADVLRHHGACIAAVSYRGNAERAKKFASKYSVGRVYQDWQTMMTREGLDSVWVCASWEEIDNLLLPVMNYGIPAFFEKPVALSSERIVNALQARTSIGHNIQVGYNRRFYRVVNRLREYLTQYRILAVELFIPEQIRAAEAKSRLCHWLQNSSHFLDLIYCVTGTEDLVVKYRVNVSDGRGNASPGSLGILETSEGIPVYVSWVWNAPLNFCLRVYASDETVFELKPIEHLRVFRGFDIVEPTPDRPIRSYDPRVIEDMPEPMHRGFKPGFEQQALHFFSQTFQATRSERTPDLHSCLKLTRLCENMVAD